MKRTLTIIQALLLIVLICVLGLTPAPVTATAIIFAAVMMVLISAGLLSSCRAEKQLKSRVTELLRELDVASTRIGSVSQEIGITIGESNISSGELFSETQEMSSLTADMTENLGGMFAQLKGMINFSEEARSTALAMENTSKASFYSIHNGMAEILHVVDTMKNIKITSNKASDSIGKLRAASGDVRSILEKISDISKQMHIIAINATVEASRAGRYGDSFAVVAKEFHNLSSMTDNSMHQIDSLINAIQKDILEVYSDVMENSARVDEGVQYTRIIEDSLTAISASFNDVTQMVDKISGISEAESRLAGDMGACVETVESLIERTTLNVRRVFDSAVGQKRGLENITEMGTKLQSASLELLKIAGSDAAGSTEKLDEKARRICADFFPVIQKELGRSPDILGNDPTRHFDVLSRFKASHTITEAVWTNETNGRFICSIPKAGIANAAMRGWFRASLSGESYISPIYISGITKKRCITLSMPYYGADGAVTGILGIDLDLDMLTAENRK